MQTMQTLRPASGSLSAAWRAQGLVGVPCSGRSRVVSTRFRRSEQDAAAEEPATQPALPLLPPQRQQQQQPQMHATSSSPFKNRQLGHSRFSRGSPHVCSTPRLFYERPDDEVLMQGWQEWWAGHVLTCQPWLAPPATASGAAAPAGGSSSGSGASRLLAGVAHVLGSAGPDPPPLRRLLLLLAGVAAGLAGAALLVQAARLLLGLLLTAYAGLPAV